MHRNYTSFFSRFPSSFAALSVIRRWAFFALGFPTLFRSPEFYCGSLKLRGCEFSAIKIVGFWAGRAMCTGMEVDIESVFVWMMR